MVSLVGTEVPKWPMSRAQSPIKVHEATKEKVRYAALMSGLKQAELVDARLHVTAPGEEVWVAIATQATEGRFVEERLRDVLFGLVLDAAEAELWEPRADWPSGELAWFEMARLGLREPPS